jgi:hypothetical protein
MEKDAAFPFESIDEMVSFIVERGAEPRNAQLSEKLTQQILKHQTVPVDQTLALVVGASQRQPPQVLQKRLKFVLKVTSSYDDVIAGRGETSTAPAYPTRQVLGGLETSLVHQNADVRTIS